MKWLAALMLFAAGPVHAGEAAEALLNPIDRDKLKLFDAIKKDALAEAEAAGPSEDLDLLKKALAGQPMSMGGTFKIEGNWRCRTIKAGARSEGLLPIVSYPQFKCRITRKGGKLFMEKVTGSQRTSGYLYPDGETRMIFLGAGTVNDDPQRAYNQDKIYNEPAYVSRLANNKLVFEFPAPEFESKLNVIVLEK